MLYAFATMPLSLFYDCHSYLAAIPIHDYNPYGPIVVQIESLITPYYSYAKYRQKQLMTYNPW